MGSESMLKSASTDPSTLQMFHPHHHQSGNNQPSGLMRRFTQTSPNELTANHFNTRSPLAPRVERRAGNTPMPLGYDGNNMLRFSSHMVNHHQGNGHLVEA